MTQPILKPSKSQTNKGSSISIIVVLCLSVFNLIAFFASNLKYTLDENVYFLSPIEVIISKGLFFEENIITFPITMRIFFIASIATQIAGIIYVIKNKLNISSIVFLLSAIFDIGAMLFASTLSSGAENFSISFLTVIVLSFLFKLINSIICGLIYSKDQFSEVIFFVASCVSVGCVILITLYMLICGSPSIYEIGIFNFLFGSSWNPEHGSYGILALILSSFAGTLGAIIIGVPIGILTAVFLAEMAPKGLADFIRPLIQLLAGIPSVVYGFWGMLCVVPLIKKVFGNLTVGDSLLAVIIILAIMILPTVISISESSLKSVPISYKEASLALGATHTTTIFKIILPAARSGILSAVILGVGRAIGEAMAVIMVAGNVVNMPSILGSVRLLTTGIVLEMSYSSGLHRQALFAIGLVLFVFIMIINISFSFISKRSEPNVKS